MAALLAPYLLCLCRRLYLCSVLFFSFNLPSTRLSLNEISKVIDVIVVLSAMVLLELEPRPL